MKRLLFCFIVSMSLSGLFAQDYSIFGNNSKDDLNRTLSFYNSSISEFISIFSSYDLRILLGNIDVLKSKYLELDIFSLSQMDNRTLRLLRNIIYARHGYKFNSKDLDTFFKRFDWYNPKYDNVDNFLTEADKYHIQMIQQFEKRNENIPNIILKDIVGFWHDSPGVGSGYGERFIFHPNSKLEFYYSEMKSIPIIHSISGNYEIKGNVLVYKIKEVYFYTNNADIVWGMDINWVDKSKNKLTLENPIILKLPITNTEIRRWSGGLERTVISIGGRDFFKFSDSVNPY